MHRTARVKRAPNREPTSLAVATTLSGENEAIDSIEVLIPGANIDPALTNHDITPPSPSQLLDCLDPNYDPSFLLTSNTLHLYLYYLIIKTEMFLGLLLLLYLRYYLNLLHQLLLLAMIYSPNYLSGGLL
jgi:hypothetical protein